MITVLVVIGHYLPGYKAGGPIRTIANMIDQLGGEFNFRLLTLDHDLSEVNPYAGVQPDAWQTVGPAQVRYLSQHHWRLLNWPALLRSISYDVLYLNSFFAQATRDMLWLRRLGRIPDKPVILAPRGEFSPGALSLKSNRKRLYLKLAKLASLCSGVTWQASSPAEKRDIESVFGDGVIVQVAPDIPARPLKIAPAHCLKQPGQARLALVGRIARMKNIDYAVKLLLHETQTVEFDIYGPLEDPVYWQECQAIIARMPPNVRVTYRGSVSPDQIPLVLANYHLLLLPTRGENFGHAILEAMLAGCPVLISDRTPWRDLQAVRAGWDLSLDQPHRFQAAITELIEMNDTEFSQWSKGARLAGERFATDPAVLDASRQMFLMSVR